MTCEEILFSSIPPSNSLVSVSDPWRAFWADTAPFKGPRLASCVASGTIEMQGHHQVCRARRKGPRTLSRKTIKNNDSVFVKNALVFILPMAPHSFLPLWLQARHDVLKKWVSGIDKRKKERYTVREEGKILQDIKCPWNRIKSAFVVPRQFS